MANSILQAFGPTMVSVLLHYCVEAAPLAVILYALAWRIMGRRKGQKLRLDRSWHLIGATMVIVGVGMARVATAFVLGGDSMQDLWSNQGIGLVGPIGVPIVLSGGATAILRRRARLPTTDGR